MEKRICQATGLELSVLGLGCWAFGGGDSDYWGEQSQQEVDRIVKGAIDLGVTYFDTAEMYNDGRSEASLGKALKGIDRNKVVIGSKIFPTNLYSGVVEEHCEASLKRLDTDYIDVYMIHWPLNPVSLKSFTTDESILNNPPRLEEGVASLQKLREQGKIKHIGISNFGPTQFKEILALESKIAVNQLCYSLLARAIELDIQPLSEQNGTGIIAYMPLQQGLLSGRYQKLEELPEIRRRTRHFSASSTSLSRHGEAGAEEEVLQALDGIRRICRETGLSMSELAIRWCIANPAVTSTIVGTRNASQLQNSAAAAGAFLSDETYRELNRITQPLLDKLGGGLDYFEGSARSRSF